MHPNAAFRHDDRELLEAQGSRAIAQLVRTLAP